MSRISVFDYETANEATRQEHDREMKLRGRMTNMKRILLRSPVAHRIYAEWFTLRDELRPALGDREVAVLCYAIALETQALIPAGFFRRALFENGQMPDMASLNEIETLLMTFGRMMSEKGHRISDEVWAQLKARFDETTLVNLAAFAGIMIATAAFTNAVEVDVDPELGPYLEGFAFS